MPPPRLFELRVWARDRSRFALQVELSAGRAASGAWRARRRSATLRACGARSPAPLPRALRGTKEARKFPRAAPRRTGPRARSVASTPAFPPGAPRSSGTASGVRAEEQVCACWRLVLRDPLPGGARGSLLACDARQSQLYELFFSYSSRTSVAVGTRWKSQAFRKRHCKFIYLF